MATNAPKGPGRRGAVKARAQAFNPRNKRWTKINKKSTRFMDQYARKLRPFKGVKKIKK